MAKLQQKLSTVKRKSSRNMQLKLVLSIVLALLGFAVVNGSYDGCKIYDVLAKNYFEKAFIKSLAINDGLDFFSFPKLLNQPVRVMVHPTSQAEFESALGAHGIKYSILDDNVAQDVSLEPHAQFEGTEIAVSRDLFSRFQRFDEINEYLNSLAKRYPKRVIVKSVGRSYEGRDMRAILITNGDGVAGKKTIFVDAGIHAREWIAPATALYIISQLTEDYEGNAHLLKDYNWLVLPVVNPDGYEYSHTKSRFWRKTRKPVTLVCTGTDGNRNFDYHWGDVGASTLPCMDDYMGQRPFSEPETQIVRDIMHSLRGRGKMYLTLHSFGNYLLYPWGFTEDLPATWRDLDEVAQAGADAIRLATGTEYTVGSSTNVLYEAAGGSDDYAFGKAGFPISITMELPAGGSGFNPSPEQIKPFVAESWIGIEAMARKVMEKY